MLTGDYRDGASCREGDLGHQRALSASGMYLSANVAAISNSRSLVFGRSSFRGVDDSALGEVRIERHELTVAPPLGEMLLEVGTGSGSVIVPGCR